MPPEGPPPEDTRALNQLAGDLEKALAVAGAQAQDARERAEHLLGSRQRIPRIEFKWTGTRHPQMEGGCYLIIKEYHYSFLVRTEDHRPVMSAEIEAPPDNPGEVSKRLDTKYNTSNGEHSFEVPTAYLGLTLQLRIAGGLLVYWIKICSKATTNRKRRTNAREAINTEQSSVT